MSPKTDPQAHYSIRVRGCIDPGWSDWLEGFVVSYEADGNTVLTGPLIDQAALHGLLARIRDLNLTLLSVNLVEETHSPGEKP